MTAESEIQAAVLRAHGARPDVRLFRNTIGEGWQGRVLRRKGSVVLLADARYVTFGLAPGSSDLIGWQTVEILPAHVGRRVARFVSAEVKTGTGRVSPIQGRWLAAVSQFGGCAGVVRSPVDLERLTEEDIA